MSSSDVERVVLARLADALATDGFVPRPVEIELVRPIAGGAQRLGVAVYDQEPEFEISLNVQIRLDIVEEIFHRATATPPEDQAVSSTTITPWAYFEPAHPCFTVDSDVALTDATDAIVATLRAVVVPFLDAHTDVRTLDRALRAPAPAPFDLTQPPYGRMRRLIVARLAGDPGFEQLVARVETELRTADAEQRAELTRLVDELRRTPPAG